jgi:hypothetical protein
LAIANRKRRSAAMSQQSVSSAFEAQYRRVFEAAESRTQVELAAFLEIRQSSISDAKRRQSIPAEWLVTLFTKKRINLEWILWGEGAQYLVPVDAEQGKSHAVLVTKGRSLEECSAQELVNELVRRAIQEQGKATIA